jgi:predicted ester cyclase
MRSVARVGTILGILAFLGACGAEPPPAPPPPPPPAPIPVDTAPPAVTPPPAPPKPTMAELEETALKAVADALNAHDAQKYASLFTPEGTSHTAGEPEAAGRDAIAASLQPILTAFPDLKFGFGHVWRKHRFVASTWAWTGTDTGGFMGKKPTGRPVGLEGVSLAWFNDEGLIREVHIVEDIGTVILQLDPKAKKGTFREPPGLPASMDIVAYGESPDEEKLLETAKSFYATLDNKKEADVMALATDETAIDDYANPSSLKGLKDWKAMFKSYTAAFPDYKQIIWDQHAIKDFVVTEGALKATHRGAFGKFHATGKPVSLQFVDIAQFTPDGKVAHIWTWSNTLDFMMQTGIIKAPKPPAAPGAAAAPAAPVPAPAPKP